MKRVFRQIDFFFSNYMTPVARRFFYVNAAVFVLTFLLGGVAPALFDRLFVLRPYQAVFQLNVWQFVTSMFAHMGFWHFALNMFALFFFAPILENHIGGRRLFWLVMLAGLTAGLAHTTVAFAVNRPALGLLGFSAASYAIVTATALYFPRLKVYLYFFIPMPLGVLAILMGVLLTADILRDGIIGGGVSHLGHLMGVLAAIVLVKVPGIWNALARVQTPAGKRRRAQASGGRFGMGHPGRHSDPDDRYNDPHWYLDQ